MHRVRLCAARSGQQSAQHMQPRSVSAPASSGASDPQNLLALRRAAAAPARTTSSRPHWPPGPKSVRAVAPNVSVTQQPPRCGQPPPQQPARARATARPATPARDLAPAQGVVLPSRAGGSSSPAVLPPCIVRRAGTSPVSVARQKNAVRSEQATCALANHVRRAAGQPLQRCAANRSAQCATAVRRFRARQCAVRRAAQCARGAAAGSAAGASALAVVKLSRAWQLSVRRGARCGPLRSAQCTTATRTCRARLRVARLAAQRAHGAAAGQQVGGWAPVGCGANLHLLRARKGPTDAWTKFGGARRRARADSGFETQGRVPLEPGSNCVRPCLFPVSLELHLRCAPAKRAAKLPLRSNTSFWSAHTHAQHTRTRSLAARPLHATPIHTFL